MESQYQLLGTRVLFLTYPELRIAMGIQSLYTFLKGKLDEVGDSLIHINA